ncbi:HEAT repeat domain-containing protein [Chitinimonas lacunae]|uniref:HEAT repeat domain-containing protein n=1 Tax=Chitinimonas lacunae TaxID=1963018 RepID=A0ABV8MJS4_9NEIS
MGLARFAAVSSGAPIEQSRSELLRALNDHDAATRRHAARDLRRHPDSTHAIGLRLRCEEEAAVREALFNSLVAIGNAAAVEELIPLLGEEDDANLRNGAIDALKQLPLAIAPHMQRLLSDPDPDRRIFAVNICESLRLREVESWLLVVIEHDQHVNVCATAVDLLGELGGEAAVVPLRRVARRFSGDPFMKFAVDTALRRIGATLDRSQS